MHISDLTYSWLSCHRCGVFFCVMFSGGVFGGGGGGRGWMVLFKPTLDHSELDPSVSCPPLANNLSRKVSGKQTQGLGVGRVLVVTPRGTQGG